MDVDYLVANKGDQSLPPFPLAFHITTLHVAWEYVASVPRYTLSLANGLPAKKKLDSLAWKSGGFDFGDTDHRALLTVGVSARLWRLATASSFTL
eukprot:1275052-Amorphochlora_amoeboformis.AAC.2